MQRKPTKVLFTGESPVYILLNIYQSEFDDLDIHRIAEKFAACKAGFPLANIFARSDFFLLSQPN